jgi:toxin ParE1/3/4
MNRQLEVRPAADRDLDEQAAYIAHRSVATADRLYQAARATFQKLCDMPLGGVWPSARPGAPKYYVWPIDGFPNHLVFYLVHDDRIEIVRVLHAARDIDSILGSEVT